MITCWAICQGWISILYMNARVVRGEALLGSVPWPSTLKQMWGQMPGPDGQPRLESPQPVGPSQPHNHRTGWSDRHSTQRRTTFVVRGDISQMLMMLGGGGVTPSNSSMEVLYWYFMTSGLQGPQLMDRQSFWQGKDYHLWFDRTVVKREFWWPILWHSRRMVAINQDIFFLSMISFLNN